jgi:hypothetical protein
MRTTSTGRHRTLTRSLALFGAAVFVVTACGGGDSVSTEDFVADLDDICHDMKRDMDDLATPTDYASAAAYGSDAADILNDGLDRMSALDAPDSLAEPYDGFQGIVDDLVKAAGDLEDAANAQDDAAIEKVNTRVAELTKERDALADSLGAATCHSDPEDTVALTTTTTTSTTTTVPITAPPISNVPISPPTTTGVDPSGIGTIDIAGAYNPPRGYTFENADDATMDQMKQAFAETTSLASSVESIGTAYVVNRQGVIVAAFFLTFWNEDIEGTAVQDAYDNEFLSTAESSQDGTTLGGIPITTYQDPDDSVGLLATSGAVSVWLLSKDQFEGQLPRILDRFVNANQS